MHVTAAYHILVTLTSINYFHVTFMSYSCHTLVSHVTLMSHSRIALQHNSLTSSPSTPPVAVQLSLTGATDILWLTLPLAK